MTVLKKDYEAVFKEGFKLGTRLARAKINLMRANDSRMIGDEIMEHAIELQVPNKVDVEIGDNWGDAGD